MSQPLVGIVMGSDSDLSIMKKASAILDEFGISSEIHVMSAHRTPDHATKYSKTARERGLKVIIAGAGGAAHLAGAMAAHSTLPVIGVPIHTSFAISGGLDALLSTAQMPSGVPVATVAVDGAKNAGILAAQIIGVEDEKIAAKLESFKEKMTQKALEADQKIQL